MKLTPSQAAIVEHRGSTLLVSASAGSGKTEVLARRCLAQLADRSKPCGVDQLLVVTFTRAAAAELRVRIAGMLHEAAARENNPRLRQHLDRQSILIDSADIDTIDAWCGRLVRENFEAAGVDPAFSILGAEEAALLERETLDRLFDDLHAGDDVLSKKMRGWVGRACKPSDDFLREAVAQLHAFRDHLIDADAWSARQEAIHIATADAIRNAARDVLAAALRTECIFQSGQLAILVRSLRDERAPAALEAYSAALGAWAGSLEDPTLLAAVAESIEQYPFPKRPQKLPDCDVRLWEEVKDRWYSRRLCQLGSTAAVDAIVTRGPSAAELVALLLEIEQQYHQRLASEKGRRAALGFGDVQRLALQILRDPANGGPSAIADSLRRRYAHVLVDEVQDTSPVQFELIRLISRDEPGHGNAFLVGDVKQSIYGFREAEPRLFAERIKAANCNAAEAQALSLSDNFRSHAGVLAPLNDAFAALFSAELGGVEYDRAARLQARRTEIANPSLDQSPRIELHIVDPSNLSDAVNGEAGDQSDDTEDGSGGDQDEMPLARIEREAAVAAGCIRELIGAARVPEKQSDGQLLLRPIRFGDIVILLRSARGNAALAAAALRAAGVPCVAVGRESMLDSLQVADVRNILALLTNRRQDLALAAYLRGPFGGLTTDDLMEIRKAHPSVPFCEAILQFAESTVAPVRPHSCIAKARIAIDQLAEWSRLARTADLPELIRRIVRDCSMRLFAMALPGGEHRVAMLQALQDYADEFSKAGPSGVAEFVEHLDALDASQLRPGAAIGVGDNVVRIMTVHASKGLEFPVVLMLNCGAWFSRRPHRAALRCDAGLGIGLRFLDYPNHCEFATAAAPLLERQAQARELDEELRLLYVAATRAREKLFFIGHANAELWSDWRIRLSAPGAMPQLMERLNARSVLDWLMMGLAADGARRVHNEGEAEAASAEKVRVLVHTEPVVDSAIVKSPLESPTHQSPLTDSDTVWIDESLRLLSTGNRLEVSGRSAVLAVSALKEQLAEVEPVTQWLPRDPHLSPPLFAIGEKPIDGRDRGTALHRFLEHADFAKLTDETGLRQEIERLLHSRRIRSADAALLDHAAISWLGATDPIRRAALAPQKCRREVPFVYALPAQFGGDSTIVRGVIDCLAQTDRGLMIFDYKTDRLGDEREFAGRIARYEVQIRFYALAASSIFRRPAEEAHLLFLDPRRVVKVDVSPAALERLLAELSAAMV